MSRPPDFKSCGATVGWCSLRFLSLKSNKPGTANKAADGLLRRPTNESPQASEACCQAAGVIRMPSCLKHTHVHASSTQQEAGRKSGEDDNHSTPTPFPNYTLEQLQTFQQRDPVISRLRHYWDKQKKPDAEKRAAEDKNVILLRQIKARDGLLYWVCKDGNLWQLLLPQVLVNDVLAARHDQTGHQAMKRMTSLVWSRCYWPRMTTAIAEWCTQCDWCIKAKNPLKSVNHLNV